MYRKMKNNIFLYFIFVVFWKRRWFQKKKEKCKNNIKTISLIEERNQKEILPMKILVSEEEEIRATNFCGINKVTNKSYIIPQIVFLKNLPKGKSIDISMNFNKIEKIITSLQTIKSQNNDYFED